MKRFTSYGAKFVKFMYTFSVLIVTNWDENDLLGRFRIVLLGLENLCCNFVVLRVETTLKTHHILFFLGNLSTAITQFF